MTLLQLMAVLLVSARLHPLLQVRRRAPRVETRVAPLLRHPAEMTLRRPLASERLEAAWADSAKAAARVTASASLPVPLAPQPSPSDAAVEPATPAFGLPPFNASERMIRVPFGRVADQLPVEMFVRAREGLSNTLRPGVSLLIPLRLVVPQLSEGRVRVRWEEIADQFPHEELALPHAEIARRLPHGSLLLPLNARLSLYTDSGVRDGRGTIDELYAAWQVRRRRLPSGRTSPITTASRPWPRSHVIARWLAS